MLSPPLLKLVDKNMIKIFFVLFCFAKKVPKKAPRPFDKLRIGFPD